MLRRKTVSITIVNYILLVLSHREYNHLIFESILSVRRAYHRLSLKTHPDRVPENQKADATEKFKVVGAVHAVLSNKSKRDLYDETGLYLNRTNYEYYRFLTVNFIRCRFRR